MARRTPTDSKLISSMIHFNTGKFSLSDSAFPPPLRNVKGFTLIESIAVILLLAIVTAIVASQSNDFGDDARVQGATEVVKNHLRYAQTKAMSSNLAWGINFAVSPYTLRDENGVTSTLPGDLPQGVIISSTVNPVMFDTSWGSPGGVTVTVTVTKGAASRTITVTKNTGFIP